MFDDDHRSLSTVKSIESDRRGQTSAVSRFLHRIPRFGRAARAAAGYDQ
jgi:hypothetical protein